jgi:mannose-1-phosphate guanylyltransferase
MAPDPAAAGVAGAQTPRRGGGQAPGPAVKAVVLVGGEGTRLRPLTETIPKPLLPIVNRPLLHRVLDHLAEHGVHEVIASSSYLEASFAEFIAERHGDPRITWITERAPLGTGGAIVNALAHVDETFFVLNGDILTDLDLTALLDVHRANDAVATIALHRVEDARPFGLVAAEADGRVVEFREKPTELVPGEINAGTYVLEKQSLRGWEPGHAVSIEREIFPTIIGSRLRVYGMRSDAYWMDLGTPEKYLQAQFDLLRGRVANVHYPAPFVAETATVDPEARLGRCVVLGERATVEAGAEVEGSVLLAGAFVGTGARVTGSVVGPRTVVGPRARASDSVLAEAVTVEEGAELQGARISAGRRVGSTATEA